MCYKVKLVAERARSGSQTRAHTCNVSRQSEMRGTKLLKYVQ